MRTVAASAAAAAGGAAVAFAAEDSVVGGAAGAARGATAAGSAVGESCSGIDADADFAGRGGDGLCTCTAQAGSTRLPSEISEASGDAQALGSDS